MTDRAAERAREIVQKCDVAIRSPALDDLEYCVDLVDAALRAHAAEAVERVEAEVARLRAVLVEAAEEIRYMHPDESTTPGYGWHRVATKIDAALAGEGRGT